MISINNLNFSYQKSEKIIDNLSFNVPKNSILGFLGANGSGKTTTIRLLLYLCKPDSGEVLIDGKELSPKSYKLYKDVGTLIETPTFYTQLSGKENFQLLSNYYNLKTGRIDEVLELVGLKDVKDKKVKKYSMGMKQRLGIAQSILHDPKLLILDEPLNGLDPKGIDEIRNLFARLKEDGKTIFISSHLLDEVEKTCDDICIIEKGKKLFDGKISELQHKISDQTEYKIICSNSQKASNVLIKKMNLESKIIDTAQLTIKAPNKKTISLSIKALVDEDISLFSVAKTKNSLENLFLKLTKNNHDNS